MSCYESIYCENFNRAFADETSLIVDIRDKNSFDAGCIPGATRFDERLLWKMRKTQQRHQPIVVYCYHGISSKEIASLLCSIGFTRVYNLEGGYAAWTAHLAHSDSIKTVGS